MSKTIIAVLIPCLNEEKTIGKVINDLKSALPEAVIYVYDNASTDKTAIIAEKYGAIVRRENKKGKGNVIRRMFREIDADCYIMVDGDDTYDTKNVRNMVDLVLHNGIDMVIGDRLSSTYLGENTRFLHGTGNIAVKWTIGTLFHSNVSDAMSGFRAFSRRFVLSYPVTCKGFDIETDMTAFALGHHMEIAYVPVKYHEREITSESKLRTIPDGIRVVVRIITLCKEYKPLFFFSIISVALTLLSSVFLVPILVEYSSLHTVSRFPTLIVCCGTYLAALISFFSGLILDNIRKMEERQIELRYSDAERKI